MELYLMKLTFDAIVILSSTVVLAILTKIGEANY